MYGCGCNCKHKHALNKHGWNEEKKKWKKTRRGVIRVEREKLYFRNDSLKMKRPVMVE